MELEGTGTLHGGRISSINYTLHFQILFISLPFSCILSAFSSGAPTD